MPGSVKPDGPEAEGRAGQGLGADIGVTGLRRLSQHCAVFTGQEALGLGADPGSSESSELAPWGVQHARKQGPELLGEVAFPGSRSGSYSLTPRELPASWCCARNGLLSVQSGD